MEHGVSRIEIEGFKSIAHVDVELGRLNVLIGANASGKSNFLSAFKLLNAITEHRLQQFVAKEGGASTLLHYGPKNTTAVSLSLWFHSPEFIEGIRMSYRVRIGLMPPDSVVIDNEYIGASANGKPKWVPFGKQQAESGLREFAQAVEAPPTVLAMTALTEHLDRWRFHHFHDTSNTAGIKQYVDVHDNRALRGDAGNLAAFLYMLRKAHPTHYAEIRDTVRLAFPLFDDFLVEPSRLNPNRILLTWRERDRENEFGPHQLSDGTLRFMCLAALLLQPFDHPDAPYTITIDEPELGLHPYAINLLASMLRTASEKVQIIVSTQSAALLSAIGDPGVVIVVDRKDGATTLERLAPERVDAWLEEYSLGDVWEKGVIGGRP